jgi:hypothetical protein
MPYIYLKHKNGSLDFLFGFSGVLYLAETDFDDFRNDYLCKYEAICKTVEAC